MRTVLTKYRNAAGNNPAQIRDLRIWSGKHPNSSRSSSCSHFFFLLKRCTVDFVRYTVSVRGFPAPVYILQPHPILTYSSTDRIPAEYLTYCHHMGVSGNGFATHERGVNVKEIN
jgi:hypothetical protein